MWSVMSEDMTLGRGEHHTKGTGRDEKEGVLANAWLLDSLGQKINGRFPMVGNAA